MHNSQVEEEKKRVRLVRACGSKLVVRFRPDSLTKGQARKSLWIETAITIGMSFPSWVRLVRACGSKQPSSAGGQPAPPGQARKSLWIETNFGSHCLTGSSRVRLVRACGSKLIITEKTGGCKEGQARKSLWIETTIHFDFIDR
ncbi:Uncharacterised protein [[Clostridium] symbiosum]|nr:Uncharacterised protein [[Clostridium] symbiosum]